MGLKYNLRKFSLVQVLLWSANCTRNVQPSFDKAELVDSQSADLNCTCVFRTVQNQRFDFQFYKL